MYSEKQRGYLDVSEEDHLLAELIQCDMAAGGLAMNGCVCMPKILVDVCLFEEYLTSSDCYLLKCCCNILEKIVLTSSHCARSTASPELSSGTPQITSAESKAEFLTESGL